MSVEYCYNKHCTLPYDEQLLIIREGLSPLEMLICQRLHGLKFGKPGYGSVEWVLNEVSMVRNVLSVVREYLGDVQES